MPKGDGRKSVDRSWNPIELLRSPNWITLVTLLAAAAVMKTWAVLAYLPYLVLAGLLAGLFTGVAAQALVGRMEKLGR